MFQVSIFTLSDIENAISAKTALHRTIIEGIGRRIIVQYASVRPVLPSVDIVCTSLTLHVQVPGLLVIEVYLHIS
jgi:hypothetical protein